MSRPARFPSQPPAGSRAPESTARAHPPLPHLGLPAARDRSVVGTAVSLAFHGLILLLLIAPITLRDDSPIVPIEQGAGGEGPAGGGGGGTRGTGGDTERLQYVAVAPPAPATAPAVEVPPVAPPPVVQEPPRPEPEPVVTPPVQPVPDAATTSTSVASTPAPISGVGGGTGNDGTAGSGPGSGGGVGSGIGTGRGSGMGPGTGGGTQENYPPLAIEMYLPPLPTPANVKGVQVIAEFDVDSTGKVLDFRFNETRNSGYNRQLREVLRSIRFRPGTRPDGTPIRMKAQIVWTL